jgi:hypothetical protein
LGFKNTKKKKKKKTEDSVEYNEILTEHERQCAGAHPDTLID